MWDLVVLSFHYQIHNLFIARSPKKTGSFFDRLLFGVLRLRFFFLARPFIVVAVRLLCFFTFSYCGREALCFAFFLFIHVDCVGCFFFSFSFECLCVHRSVGRWMYLVNMCIYPVLRYSERDAFNDNDLSIEVVSILYFCSPFARLLFPMVSLHIFCLVVVCRLLCLLWYSCLLPSLLLLLTEINSLNPKLIVATIPKMHSKLIETKSFFYTRTHTQTHEKEKNRRRQQERKIYISSF